MVGVRVVIDKGELDRMLRGAEMAAHLTKVAERGAGMARNSQRGADRKGEIVSSTARDEGGTLRATFGSTSSFYHLEEFGSRNNPPYRTLTNAANALGLHVEPTGR